MIVVGIFHFCFSIYCTFDTLQWLCCDRRLKTAREHELAIGIWKGLGVWPLKIEPFLGMSTSLSSQMVMERKRVKEEAEEKRILKKREVEAEEKWAEKMKLAEMWGSCDTE